MLFLVLYFRLQFQLGTIAGHKFSAFIARRQMAPEVRAKAAKLLLAAPEDSRLSVYSSAGTRSKEAKELELFMVTSTWSDIMRTAISKCVMKNII